MSHARQAADRLLIRPASGRQVGTGLSARTDQWKDTRDRGHSQIESQAKSTGTTLLGGDLVFGGLDPDGRSHQVLGAVTWEGRLEPWHVDAPPGTLFDVEHIAPIRGGLLVAGSFDWLGPPGQQAAGGIGWLR